MGILSFLTGGSKQSSQSQSSSLSHSESDSESKNLAYDYLFKTLSPQLSGIQTGSDTSVLRSILGYDDPALGQAGFQQYKDLGGFDFLAQRGTGGLVANRAASGLLNSGGSQKKLAQFGIGLQNQFLQDYIKSLFGLGSFEQDTGFKAADLIRGAGQYSTSSSVSDATSQSTSTSKGKSTGGIADIIGAAAGAIAASDARLKNIIKKVDELPNGLGVYEFEYKGQPGQIHRGVIAQEVREIMPHALGPKDEYGYMTVDYEKIWKEMA